MRGKRWEEGEGAPGGLDLLSEPRVCTVCTLLSLMLGFSTDARASATRGPASAPGKGRGGRDLVGRAPRASGSVRLGSDLGKVARPRNSALHLLQVHTRGGWDPGEEGRTLRPRPGWEHPSTFTSGSWLCSPPLLRAGAAPGPGSAKGGGDPTLSGFADQGCRVVHSAARAAPQTHRSGGARSHVEGEEPWLLPGVHRARAFADAPHSGCEVYSEGGRGCWSSDPSMAPAHRPPAGLGGWKPAPCWCHVLVRVSRALAPLCLWQEAEAPRRGAGGQWPPDNLGTWRCGRRGAAWRNRAEQLLCPIG